VIGRNSLRWAGFHAENLTGEGMAVEDNIRRGHRAEKDRNYEPCLNETQSEIQSIKLSVTRRTTNRREWDNITVQIEARDDGLELG
jgi:hypothetical protein